MQLKIGTVYVVDSAYETYIGTYRGVMNNKYFPPYKNVLCDVKAKIKNNSKSVIPSNPILVQYISIHKDDIVYDLDKIKQVAKKAKETFEKRALDKILRRLVNEEFEWS
jgi:hypothetical protein